MFEQSIALNVSIQSQLGKGEQQEALNRRRRERRVRLRNVSITPGLKTNPIILKILV